MKGIVNEVKAEILKVECRIFDVEKDNDELQKKVKQYRREIEEKENSAKQTVSDLEQKLTMQTGKLNDLEQYGRRNNVIIIGIPEEHKNEPESPSTTIKKSGKNPRRKKWMLTCATD